MPHLTYSLDGGLATVVLDNPPQNRIGRDMVDQLSAAVDAIAASDARAVLLRAEGPDFSFGGDIVPWPDWNRRQLRSAFEHYLFTFNRFEQLPLPVIAAVHGLCAGGGLELAVRADVIFAAESARFAHPEQTLGIVTLLGGVYRVAERVGRARAAEWALTSEQIPARVLAEAGLVNHVVPDGELRSEAEAFARKVAGGPTRAHAAHKALLRTWAVGGVAAADDVMFDVALPLFDTGDVEGALKSAVDAFHAGKPRPVYGFQGR
ncbi:enoyl-CoA hydratase/isomerase family protein [Amycolatopsis sp. A133]|uniref:enoyl-CoA hydratase/isomerase family protein n=1 Tax=Amycolatopsis sp. A133 TaxID=3064472 RepID=UPI0027F211BD|nr:enoyl-CoA hydratase/isomerase family protein [Amycolatopsis sp. A133]MDQ7809019.1 enoyl-CoA hydratase/isomerase family protein [Amycolatopsis sp. A133]